MPEKTDRFEIPGWLPPVLYAVLTAFLFREFILTDRMLFGSDTLGLGYVARELYAEALTTLGRIPGWSPHILGGTPFLEALSGGDSLYPPSLLLLLLTETHRALGWKLILHVFAAGLFFFGWIRAIGGSRSAALLGGTAYMLAPFLVGFVHPGHDGKIFVTTLAPLLFWVTERHFARPGWATVSGIGLVVALILYTTHFQMAYFLFGGVGLYAIFRSVQIARGVDEVVDGGGGEGAGNGGDEAGSDEARAGSAVEDRDADAGQPERAGLLQRTGGTGAGVRFALFLTAAILGAGGAAYQFLPAADYVTEFSRRTQTTREAAGTTGRAWSSSWSMHPEEAMSLVVPEFVGNQAGGAAWAESTYWGRNALKDNHEYAGLIVLLLAAVSFVGARRKQLRWFFAVLGLLAVAFGLGSHTPVWGLFYAVVPGIRLFRAPGMVVFLFGFGAITLAALGVDRMLSLAGASAPSGDGSPPKGAKKGPNAGEGAATPAVATLRKVLWGALGFIIVLGLLIGSGAFTSFWTTVVYPEIDARRLQMLQAHLPNIVRGASVAVLLVAAGVGLVWGTVSGRIPAKAGLAGLVLLVALDAGRIDRAFIETVDFHQWSQADPNVRAILEREAEDGDPYRLFSLAGAGQDVTPAMHGIELAAGHHPNDLSRYRELIGMVGSGLPQNLLNPNVRRILNVEYILWPDMELGPAPEGGTVVSRTQLGDGRAYQTVLADEGLPRARLVAEAVVRSDAEAVEYIMSPEHDPAREAVLPAEPPTELGGGEVTGSVVWVEREIDHMTLEVQSDRPALLIVADNWFPAWRATVDGEEAEVLRAYHTVRAVPVPAGSSTVDMWYASDLLRTSRWISLLILLGLIMGGAWGIWRRRSGGLT